MTLSDMGGGVKGKVTVTLHIIVGRGVAISKMVNIYEYM